MTTTPYGDAPQLGNEVLEDEEEKKPTVEPVVEKPKEEEKTLRETLPKWTTDPSVMKKANWFQKFGHTLLFGDYHPSQLTGLEVGGKPYLDHTKSELKELSTRDFSNMLLDRAKDDAITEFNILSENLKEGNWGQLLTRPIYGATRVLPFGRDISNTAYLGTSTAATGTLSFLVGETFPKIRDDVNEL